MNKTNSKYFAPSFLIFLLMFLIACQSPQETVAENTAPSHVDSNINASPAKIETPMPLDGKMPAPVAIGNVTRKGGKPPLQLYSFDIEFKSRRENYQWLLMRYFLDQPLNENGIFPRDQIFENPVGANQFFGKQTKDNVVMLHFFGREGFYAIRLPAQGVIKFSPLHLDGWADVSQFEVWEVRSLLVNGKTPLEEWLPYETLSNPTKRPLDSGRYEGINDLNFEGNSNKRRTDFRKETIDFIEAKGIRKWLVPFKASAEE